MNTKTKREDSQNIILTPSFLEKNQVIVSGAAVSLNSNLENIQTNIEEVKTVLDNSLIVGNEKSKIESHLLSMTNEISGSFLDLKKIEKSNNKEGKILGWASLIITLLSLAVGVLSLIVALNLLK